MSEDPEEKMTFVQEHENKRLALTFCNTNIRTSTNPLTILSFIKTAVTILLIETICLFGIFSTQTYRSWLTCICIGQLVVKTTLYIVMYANLLSGGWGSSDRRFWCDVNIMYVRGFNTIRNISGIFSLSLYVWAISIILNVQTPLFLAIVPLLAVISEWQAALSENINQDSISVMDKYITSDNVLCLESLNYYQSQKKDSKYIATPFVLNCLIKTYIIACVLIAGIGKKGTETFAIPMVVSIIFYIYVLALTLDFMYIKQFQTFCQIELYRMAFDCVFPVIIAAFSLV